MLVAAVVQLKIADDVLAAGVTASHDEEGLAVVLRVVEGATVARPALLQVQPRLLLLGAPPRGRRLEHLALLLLRRDARHAVNNHVFADPYLHH